MATQRNSRQDAIREIVRNKAIRTQRTLVDELLALGYNCTQATVSRDITDMGLRKLRLAWPLRWTPPTCPRRWGLWRETIPCSSSRRPTRPQATSSRCSRSSASKGGSPLRTQKGASGTIAAPEAPSLRT